VVPLRPPRGGEPAAASPPVLRPAISQLVSRDRAFLEALEVAFEVAQSSLPVVICGESGTGKELLARAIHECSPRVGRPFVAFNCAAIPEQLLESELFGHEKGAFTGAERRRIGRFERASGGTLFLDEIGDMQPALQAKILRVLETREVERVGGDETIAVNVRLLAATNQPIRKAVAEGRFREDLYYRLAGTVVTLPPLRHRPDDITLLARHFLAQYASQYAIAPSCDLSPLCEEVCESCWMTPAACQLLTAYPWPGNVRELRQAVERAVVLARHRRIEPAHLPPEIVDGARAIAERPGGEGPLVTLREAERRQIAYALAHTNGNRTRAAELLGIHRNTLRTKMREHGLA